MRKVRKVLLKAANILEEQGWCQGDDLNWQGKRCAVAAIMASGNWLTASKARKIVGDLVSTKWSCVVSWNDATGRTAEQVISKLREAAASLEATTGTEQS